MERNKWQFEFVASKLAEAAQAKINWHTERIKSLNNEIAETDDGFIDDFKTISDDDLEKMSIKEQKEYDQLLAESRERMSQHATKILEKIGMSASERDYDERKNQERKKEIKVSAQLINEYGIWLKILSANPESNLSLDVDDWLFFFGKEGDKMEFAKA
jgi:cell shape-determining protein MreC